MQAIFYAVNVAFLADVLVPRLIIREHQILTQ